MEHPSANLAGDVGWNWVYRSRKGVGLLAMVAAKPIHLPTPDPAAQAQTNMHQHYMGTGPYLKGYSWVREQDGVTLVHLVLTSDQDKYSGGKSALCLFPLVSLGIAKRDPSLKP